MTMFTTLQCRKPLCWISTLAILLLFAMPSQAQGEFKKVDEFARIKVASSVAKDVKKLSKHMASDWMTEKEKVRSIFIWITHNVKYDVSAYFNNTKFHINPDDVLRRKRGVCSAYSSLFKAMCDEAGIECREVFGYSRGYGFRKGKVRENLHAWNAVKIDGEWYLFDATWAAGGVGRDKKFQFQFSEDWWMSDPAEFAKMHFPWSPMWQLLETPVSFDDFAANRSASGFWANYQYSDSIAHFDGLRAETKEIEKAKSCKAFDAGNPLWLAQELMIAGETMLYPNGTDKPPTKNPVKLLKAADYFQEAQIDFKASKGELAKHNRDVCKGNEKYCRKMAAHIQDSQ